MTASDVMLKVSMAMVLSWVAVQHESALGMVPYLIIWAGLLGATIYDSHRLEKK